MSDDQNDNKKFRILSLDGGSNSGGLVAALLLGHMLKRCKGLLERTDFIFGTSAGIWTALAIATQKEGEWDKGLEMALEQLWSDEGTNKMIAPHWLPFIFCGKSLYQNNFEQVLEPILKDKKLTDLSKRVLATSVILHGSQRFGPKFWDSRETPSESALTVALTSSAAPVLAPIRHGNVDGALLTNNPSMEGLLHLLKWRHGESRLAARDEHNIVMLSIGNGLTPLQEIKGDHDWGWPQWLTNIKVLRLLYGLNIYPVAYDCKLFFSGLHYPDKDGMIPFCRVNPTVESNLSEVIRMYIFGRSGPMNDTLRKAVDNYLLDKEGSLGESTMPWCKTQKWLDRYWIGDHESEEGNTRPAT